MIAQVAFEKGEIGGDDRIAFERVRRRALTLL
jgi:hypothetical protein